MSQYRRTVDGGHSVISTSVLQGVGNLPGHLKIWTNVAQGAGVLFFTNLVLSPWSVKNGLPSTHTYVPAGNDPAGDGAAKPRCLPIAVHRRLFYLRYCLDRAVFLVHRQHRR